MLNILINSCNVFQRHIGEASNKCIKDLIYNTTINLIFGQQPSTLLTLTALEIIIEYGRCII